MSHKNKKKKKQSNELYSNFGYFTDLFFFRDHTTFNSISLF